MSKEFIQCAGQINKQDDDVVLYGYGDNKKDLKDFIALCVPKNASIKERMECIMNVAQNMSQALSKKTSNIDGSWITEDGIDEQLAVIIRNLSLSLQYISNCYSWQNGGKLQDFDKIKVQEYIKNIMGVL